LHLIRTAYFLWFLHIRTFATLVAKTAPSSALCTVAVRVSVVPPILPLTSVASASRAEPAFFNQMTNRPSVSGCTDPLHFFFRFSFSDFSTASGLAGMISLL
jgi:hypothetical protein